jgi:hypothetical protein
MIPIPARLTVGLLLALSATVSVSVNEPATEGPKDTDTVQVELAASVAGPIGQVVVIEKMGSPVVMLAIVSGAD